MRAALSAGSRRAINALGGALGVGLLLLVIWNRRDDLEPLGDVPVRDVVFVAALVALGHYINAVEFWALFRAAGARIGLAENWLLYTAGQLLNYLPGQVGTLYRLRYLRAVHSLSMARSSSAYGMNLLLTVLSTGVLGLVGTMLVGVQEDVWSFVLILTFAGLTGLVLIGSVVPLPTTRRSGRLARAWMAFRSGWRDLQREKRLIAFVIALEVLKYLITAWRLQLTFRWIGIDESYALFLVIAPVIGLATFVGLTPAALGFRELSVSGAAAALGRSFSEGLLGATIDRALLLVVTVFLGTWGLVASERRIRLVQRAAPQQTAAAEQT